MPGMSSTKPIQFGLASLFSLTAVAAGAAWFLRLIPLEVVVVWIVLLTPFLLLAICWPHRA
jgi:hypothetical protein